MMDVDDDAALAIEHLYSEEQVSRGSKKIKLTSNFYHSFFFKDFRKARTRTATVAKKI